MIKEINTEILIHQTPEKVWDILTNFDNYAKWNPFIKSLQGKVEVDNVIKVKIVPPSEKGMTFKPKVLTYEHQKELSWIGHLFFSGLFDGKHKLELIDNLNGTTTFRQSEKFKGVFVRFFNLESTKKGFEMMNKKLKELAEE